jgi:hypothetical protein
MWGADSRRRREHVHEASGVAAKRRFAGLMGVLMTKYAASAKSKFLPNLFESTAESAVVLCRLV